MKKKLLVILSILAVILACRFVQAEVGQQTINYLLNGPQDAWVTQGLAAAGQTNLNLSYLDNFSGSSANDYAKTILALAAAGENPYSYNGTNFVTALEAYHQNSQIGDPTLLSDDFWAVLALRSAGKDIADVLIQDSKNFILTNQNADGGWSYAPGGGSDTNDTAAAIMALLDAGSASTDPEILSAITYLQNSQNSDGGFAFVAGSESDSGSDSWVIAALYKLGVDPASWTQGENNPVSHLESLMLADGSFTWVASNPVSNVLMTAYAVVALSESYYPVSYFDPPEPDPVLHHLRIEGASQTYCDELVEAVTALDIIENGASICGYTYQIEQTSFGPYLAAINGEAASGMSGWLYRVNWDSPFIGANEYILEEGDEVLWYFGEFTDLPLKLELSDDQIELAGEVTATVEYYNNGSWLAANGATVFAGNNQYTANDAGQATLTFSFIGSYQIYAEKESYIRSNHEDLIVGSGISQSVGLLVNINNPGGPPGDTISFSIDTSSLDFGALEPGQFATSSLMVTNTGDLPIYLEAVVSGDAVFEDNLYLNQVLWEMFSSNVETSQSQNVPVQLNVPAGFAGSGQKNGSLIFWATGQ
ncbi:DUF4430 domain-containing protein [Patescibacteria group bacterium]|nr:DUF4430 domain-containing protein [Patescibacteria group bacterium]